MDDPEGDDDDEDGAVNGDSWCLVSELEKLLEKSPHVTSTLHCYLKLFKVLAIIVQHSPSFLLWRNIEGQEKARHSAVQIVWMKIWLVWND